MALFPRPPKGGTTVQTVGAFSDLQTGAILWMWNAFFHSLEVPSEFGAHNIFSIDSFNCYALNLKAIIEWAITKFRILKFKLQALQSHGVTYIFPAGIIIFPAGEKIMRAGHYLGNYFPVQEK